MENDHIGFGNSGGPIYILRDGKVELAGLITKPDDLIWSYFKNIKIPSSYNSNEALPK